MAPLDCENTIIVFKDTVKNIEGDIIILMQTAGIE